MIDGDSMVFSRLGDTCKNNSRVVLKFVGNVPLDDFNEIIPSDHDRFRKGLGRGGSQPDYSLASVY
jgi:hypothetical protein